MHDRNSSWRGRLPANAGTLGGALLACLCAGQLAASAPASSAAASSTAASSTAASSTAAAATTEATAGYALAASVAPVDSALESATDTRVAAVGARADVARATRSADRAKRLTASRLQSVARSQAASRSANRTASSAERPAGTGGTTGQSGTASRADRILAEARRHIGAPYEFGASGPAAFDCSGFTAYVFRKVAGIDLPHKADSQQYVGRVVSRSAARPGDLIIFRNGSYGYHVGIYAGSGYMYDSPRSGDTVGKHKIWSDEYVIRRVLG